MVILEGVGVSYEQGNPVVEIPTDASAHPGPRRTPFKPFYRRRAISKEREGEGEGETERESLDVPVFSENRCSGKHPPWP